MIRIVETREDLWKVLVIRGIVFIEEQKVDWEGEIDAFEDDSLHFLGEVDGQPAAAGRLRFVDDGWAKLERVAVRSRWRGQGLARQIVAAMLASATEKGVRKLKLHAQVYLKDFYASFGFRVEGGIFRECDIDHILMIRKDGE